MVVTPHVEVASISDVEALAQQRTAEGWLRSETLLHAMLTWDRGRIFLVREGELNAGAKNLRAPVATTSAIAAGPVGVIGNVITSAHYRRRGLGRLVMEASLAWLRKRGVRTVLLDATEDGRPLYTKIGFVGQASSIFGHGALGAMNIDALGALARGHRATLAEPGALKRLASLDTAAFGGDRMEFLSLLLAMPGHWLYVVDDTTGAPVGYVLARLLEAPYSGVRIGPLVARDRAAAAALLAAALAPNASWRRADAGHPAHPAHHEPQAFVSLPSTSAAALDLFVAAGLTLVEDDLIMRLDFAAAKPGTTETPPLAEHPEWIYAWLAPMVF